MRIVIASQLHHKQTTPVSHWKRRQSYNASLQEPQRKLCVLRYKFIVYNTYIMHRCKLKRWFIQEVQKRISRYFKVTVKYSLLKTTEFWQFLIHLINPKDIIQTNHPYAIQDREIHKLRCNWRTVIASHKDNIQCSRKRGKVTMPVHKSLK